MFAHDYGVNVNRLPFEADPGENFHCDVPNMSTCLYYSSNDAFHSSPTAERNIGQVVVLPFSMAAVDYPELMSAYYGKLAHLGDPTVALNSLLVQDGLFIYVPDGVVPERPIQLVNIFNAALDMMVQRRLLIVVGKNAALKLLACDHTQSPDYRYLNNQVVEIVAMQGSTVDYYDMEESTPQTNRVSSIYVEQHEGSNVLIDGITLINGFTRNNYHVEVNGEHAETHLLGMTIASGEQHVDILVLNIVIHGPDGVMDAWMQQVEDSCFLFAYHHIMAGRRLEVAHVLHGHSQVITGAFGLQGIVKHRFFTDFFQCAVYPLGAVGT